MTERASDDMLDASWQSIGLPDAFRLAVPAGTRWFQDDAGKAFVVRLPTEPATDIRISRHDRPDGVDGPSWLEGRIHAFFRTAVPRATDASVSASVQPCGTHPDAVQGIATHGDGSWWLVRACAIPGDYFWLQWYGPERDLRSTVLQVFESFAPMRSRGGTH
jgi:hypothetical protein